MAKGDIPQISNLDRLIVACLQTNGRASWSAIATVTGVSETTVARRVQQMTEAGIIRTVGVLDSFRAGLGMPTLVRIGCAPGMADSVSAAIADRGDARTVTVVTGIADCVAELIVPDRAAMHRVLLQELPAVDGVRSTDSLVVLRTFRAAQLWEPRLLDRASTAQLLPQPQPPFEDGSVVVAAALDEVDRVIAAGLGEDGRMPYRDLAGRAGISETTAARRVESMVSNGCLQFRTLISPQLLGYRTEAMLWLTVDARYLDRVGRRLVEEPSVKELVATAGSYHLVGRVALAHHQDLYALLNEWIGSLPGVRDVDVTFELQTLKRSWVLGADVVPESGPAELRPGRGKPDGRASSMTAHPLMRKSETGCTATGEAFN
jgi:DNA-binding Lrp family transcriptional regulator